MKKIITTDGAPKAIGPYSQAIEVDGCIYTSGQLPIDPKTGQMPKTVEAQTRQSLENVKAILKQRGLNFGTVFKTTVFLSDMNNFSKMNAVYAEYFSGSFPARSCVEVARLPKDAKVEIEVIAAE
jgi:2-iminobutanoate/2-iminopropanoate deaminase